MHLADHIRPLLRDHDCVIIPDFGGLVAEAAPARLLAGRQLLAPPSKLVAFNQALTRNDGLLVDALAHCLGLSIAQAREQVREAVAGLQQELNDAHRTELPGIGVFRRASGRGLSFEYTGTDNLLPAAYGLSAVAIRPVRATDARLQRPQPVLRSGRSRVVRWLPGAAVGLVAVLVLATNYFVAMRAGYLPTAWQMPLPQWEWSKRPTSEIPNMPQPQQATLAHHDWVDTGEADAYPAPAELASGVDTTPVATQLAASNATLASAPESAESMALANTTIQENEVPAPGPAASARLAAPVATAPAVAPSVVKTPVAAPVIKPKNTPATTTPPAATLTGTPSASKETAVAPVAKPAAPAALTTIKNRTGRYFVIAGAYSSLAHAEQGRRVLTRTGHPSRIILPFYGSRLFRLTAADYATKAEAEVEARRLRLSTHCDYITLKF